MRVSNAFGKVFESVNIVSDKYLEINEWRSVLVRLREFEREMYQTSGGERELFRPQTPDNPPSPTNSDGEIQLSPVRVVGTGHEVHRA